MISRAQAHIDLAALQHNFTVVKTLAPRSQVMAMIKANGYGHGAVRVAKALRQADAFGVACVEEGLELRAAKITQPIAIMNGVSTAEELQIAAAQQLQIVVHHRAMAEMIAQTTLAEPVTVWLKIDTGMHRLGIPPAQIAAIYQQLNACASVKQPLHLMTHFAEADNPTKDTTQRQLDIFAQCTADLPGPKTLANSAGIIAWSGSHADWVRPGVMLYGISPQANKNGSDFDLRPVLTLQSKLIAVNALHRGDAVGYGGIWTCPEDMPVGVVAIGYGDGYPRHAKNGTPVLINGVRCPLIGRVSMDMIMVDLRNCPQARINDQAILWGAGLPAEEVARFADTIAYTLLCGLSQRVKYVEEHP